MPLEPLPPLPEERIPPAWGQESVRTESIVRRLAEAQFTVTDLYRIREVLELRRLVSWMAPRELELAVADLKSRLHSEELRARELEAKLAAAEEELAMFRRFLGSTIK